MEERCTTPGCSSTSRSIRRSGPAGALLRTSVMATHDRATLDRAIAIIGEVKHTFEAEHGALPTG